MPIEVHVQGRVKVGHLADFYDAVKTYQEYAKSQGYRLPKVLFGLSGDMNTVRLVYHYEDLNAYESHEVRTLTDRTYAEIAEQMGFVDGSLHYAVYRIL